MRRLVFPLLAALLLVIVARGGLRAQSPDILADGGVDGGFEAGGAGWTVSSAAASFDGSGPVQAGDAAAHLTSTGADVVILASKYWLVATAPGAEHTLHIWVYNDDPQIDNVVARLEFVDGAGATVGGNSAPLSGDSPQYRQVVVGPLVAPSATAFARVSVRATSLATSATFHVRFRHP